MRILILIVTLILIGLSCIGQVNTLTKNELFKIFKKSIDQPEKNRISIGNNAWIINNEDSAYYKQDTIILSMFNNQFNKHNICQTIDWTFYKKDAFIMSQSEHCAEPPTTNVSTSQDFIKIEMEDNNKLIIRLSNFNTLVDVFQVLMFEDIDGNSKLTLLRER